MNTSKDLEFYRTMKLLDFLKFEDSIHLPIYFGSVVCSNNNCIEGFIKIQQDKETIIILDNKEFVEKIIFISEIKTFIHRDLTETEINKIISELNEGLKKI